jgi:1,4-dihydroxy-6-naphthoate synthase
MKIQMGYTPTSDDAYMLYGLLEGKVDCGDLQIESVEGNLPTLNDYSSRGQLEATMISAAAYAYVFDRYSLLSCGSSFGIGCGPVVVTREAKDDSDMTGMCVAIPGATTTAYACSRYTIHLCGHGFCPWTSCSPQLRWGWWTVRWLFMRSL